MSDHDTPEIKDDPNSDDCLPSSVPRDKYVVYGVVERTPEELKRQRKHDRWYTRWRHQKCEEKDEGSWYNTRKRSCEYADEVLDKAIAYALNNNASKKSKSGHAWYPSCDTLVCQHVKAQLMHDNNDFKDEDKRTDYMQKIAEAHEELAQYMGHMVDPVSNIASALEGSS